MYYIYYGFTYYNVAMAAADTNVNGAVAGAIVVSIILLAINPSTLAVVLLKRIFLVTLLIFFILPHF
ncbi:hypothetical protein MC1_05480 [Rickettsia parkeri str. Portsmouth]|nr:hypothetical protein MC1_05480 [Rickettsia parkeri str. Portsmouth]